MAALLTAMWLVSLITPEAYAVSQGVDAGGLFQVLKKPEVFAFFVVYMLLQIAHGPYYVFYSVFLNHYHYSGTLTGFLWSLGVCAEIVLFIFMRRLLRRFSLRDVLLTSIALGIVRWLTIAWCADSLVLLLSAQLLHAATFGAAHVAGIHLVDFYFGHRHQGKGQALYSSMSFGLGGMLGSLYSGYFWESLGPQFVYTLAAFISCIAFVVAYVWVGRVNAKLATLG